MSAMLGHIALIVPRLESAEEFYRRVFAMQTVTREVRLADGLWYGLRPESTWTEVRAAGIEPGMLALRRGQFVLALFPGQPEPGQVFEIGVQMPPLEIRELSRRLPAEVEIIEDALAPEDLLFKDPYGYTWHIYSTGDEFLGIGETAGRWLHI